MQPATDPRLRQRYPERMLLVSLLILFVIVVVRLVVDEPLSVAPSSSGAAPAPAELSSEAVVMRLRDAIRANPENSSTYAQLGQALLQRVRETGDPILYTQAETAFNEALQRNDEELDALIGQGMLALARHDFDEAIEWAEQARTLNPYRAQILGIIVDAEVELGRYDEAVATLQEMVNLRPDLASYSRVSYVRELHGDVPGAIEMMRAASETGLSGSEQMLWTQVQLGHLYFNSGQLEQAEKAYREALWLRPDYPYAQAGVARVLAARGDYAQAIATYQTLVDRLPLPEFAIALGELYEVTSQPEAAARQYDLVHAIQQLNASVGMDVDLELALFEAEHGDPALALQLARAAYEQRPGLYAADALAWALYQNGAYDEAARYSDEALRLGTQDAMLYYHAGRIAHALNRYEAAGDYLQTALAINPAFSVRYAPEAQALLEQLAP